MHAVKTFAEKPRGSALLFFFFVPSFGKVGLVIAGVLVEVGSFVVDVLYQFSGSNPKKR
jgi:hypothetical protein